MMDIAVPANLKGLRFKEL